MQFLLYPYIVILISTFGNFLFYSNQDNSIIYTINSKYSWHPTWNYLNQLNKKCSKTNINKSRCFEELMRKSRATQESINFAKLMKYNAYISEFREMGKIHIAYIKFPFSQSEKSAFYLVNGNNILINMDDKDFFPKRELEKDTLYIMLSEHYPKIEIYPDDRTSNYYYPAMEQIKDKGQRFIAKYVLRSGCNTCEKLGKISVGFDFDSSGNYISTKFLQFNEVMIKN
jgi:hypothetical protein